MTELHEQAVQFGPDNRLHGIVSQPPTRRPDAPACLLLNAGVVHRVGPHRLNVKVARDLAERGVLSLRFDLSGIGDSATGSSAEEFGEQALSDMRAAMDRLQASHGVTRFVVFGICSGAINAYRLALADARVVGVLMFDGLFYPTLKTHWLRRWRRLRAQPWRTIAGPLRARFAGRAPDAPGATLPFSATYRDLPSREQFERAMTALTARGVDVYLIYSGSVLEAHNYDGQLRDAFGAAEFLARVRCDYMPDVDHTVTPLSAQRKLVGAVREWVHEVTSRSAAAVTAPASPSFAMPRDGVRRGDSAAIVR